MKFYSAFSMRNLFIVFALPQALTACSTANQPITENTTSRIHSANSQHYKTAKVEKLKISETLPKPLKPQYTRQWTNTNTAEEVDAFINSKNKYSEIKKNSAWENTFTVDQPNKELNKLNRRYDTNEPNPAMESIFSSCRLLHPADERGCTHNPPLNH